MTNYQKIYIANLNRLLEELNREPLWAVEYPDTETRIVDNFLETAKNKVI